MNSENFNAWVGLNLQDSMINIGGVLAVLGFIVKDLQLQQVFFIVAFIFSAIGLLLYFIRSNPNVDKNTGFLNRWLSVVIVLVLWIAMGVWHMWSLNSSGDDVSRLLIDKTEYIVLTPEFIPKMDKEGNNHAVIISDRREIKKVIDEYSKIDNNHACGFTHSIQFWSEEMRLLTMGLFNEDVDCGGRNMRKYLDKLANSPTHYMYDVEIPSDISVIDLDSDLEHEDLEAFFDPRIPINLRSIEVTYISAVQATDGSSPTDDELDRMVEDFINDAKSAIQIDYVSKSSCSPYTEGNIKGCTTQILFRLSPSQDIEMAESYLLSIQDVEIDQITDEHSYMVKVYYTSDNLDLAGKEIMQKLPYVISVK